MSDIELLQDESLIYSLTEGYLLELDDARAIRYAPSLGFMALESEDCLYALGFYPMPPGWSGPPPERITPVTNLAAVPQENRTIDLQGKGVGPRLYSTRQSISGLATPIPAGLYGVQISPDVRLLDIRAASDKTVAGQGLRIARHAGRMLRTKFQGLESVVEGIHEDYGDADLVLFNRPPNVARRQRSREVDDIEGADSTVIIVRDPDLELVRVGRRILT